MNLVEKLYYKIFKSEEEYQTQVEYEARRAYIIEYIKSILVMLGTITAMQMKMKDKQNTELYIYITGAI